VYSFIKVLLMTTWSRVLSKNLVSVHLVQNFTVGVCVHKFTQLDPILNRTDPFHNLTYFFKIYFNIIPQSVHQSLKLFLSFRFSD
jgi:hypothetical protein